MRCFVVGCVPLFLACVPEPTPGFAHAYVMEDLSEGVGGPKALAQPGDFVLENDRVRFAILGERVSFGPGKDGGGLVDADLSRPTGQWSDGRGNDHFVEFVSTANLFVPGVVSEQLLGPGSVAVLPDTGDAAVVRVSAPSTPFLDLVRPLVNPGLGGQRPGWMVTDYILRPNQDWVTVRTTVSLANLEFEPPVEGDALPGLRDPQSIVEHALLGGLAFGDFLHLGGDVDVFASDIGFHELGALHEAELADRNLFIEPFGVDYVGGTSHGVSYGLAALEGDLLMPLFASSQTVAIGAIVDSTEVDAALPTASWTYERVFAVGKGDMGSVLDSILEARKTPRVRVRGHVLEESTGKPLSGAHVFVYREGADAPYTEWQTDVGLDDERPDGSFSGFLPEGRWEIQVHENGRPTATRLPLELSHGNPKDLTLSAKRTGEVLFRVVDETGLSLPSKVTIFREDGASVRDPVLGDGFIGGDPAAVLFSSHGNASAHLPPGGYVAYATRGPEYELGQAAFEVGLSRPTTVDLQVVRSVDTSGWISADLHVHAQPSFDSGVTPHDRVITMAAEGVEFLVSSDHDYIFDYAPTIEAMEMESWVNSGIGLEVTPVEAGHYIGFPLDADFLTDVGGAIDWTGLIPSEIIEEIRALGQNPMTFVAHPRDGILGYFDQFGFDPYSGLPGAPVANPPATSLAANPDIFDSKWFTLDFDALEIFNGKRFEFIRTPTQPEMDRHAEDGSLSIYDMVARTDEEQEDLQQEVYELGAGIEGQVDDWFTLLNLGYRHTALGNSDTHGKTTVEAGCPRNWVLSETDDPAYVDAQELAEAIREHQVVLSYGPFISFWAEGDSPIGSEVSVDDGTVKFDIEVRSPSWFNVDRVELYENGTLVDSWSVETPNVDVVNFSETITMEGTQDAWYVVVALGDDSLEPLFTPVDVAPVQLQDVVSEALVVVPALATLAGSAVPIPKTGGVVPYALTNPIWVDRDGGGFDAPGLPDWLDAPVPPGTEPEGD